MRRILAILAAALFLPTLALGQVATGRISPTSDVSGNRVTATGSTTARALAARAADVVNVKDFGAKGDGSTDDTTAINAAFTAASSTQTVVLPSGTYIVSDTISINGSNTVVGNGSNSTALQWKAGASGTGKAILRLRGRTVTLRGLHLEGNASNAPDTGIEIYPDIALIAQQHVFEDVWEGTSTPPGVGLWSHDPPGGQQHEMIAIRNSRINGVNIGVKFDKVHEDLWTFSNCFIGHTSGSGSSIKVMPGANGMGLMLQHTWLIGPNVGFENSGQWDDMSWDDAGVEGPATCLLVNNSIRVRLRGQGFGAPSTVALNQILYIDSIDSFWVTTTAGAKLFSAVAGAAIIWRSARDHFTLDAANTDDVDAFAAQAVSGAGSFNFAAEYSTGANSQRIVSQPLRVGGARTAWFYLPTSKPMLEVQPLFVASSAMRLRTSTGTVQFEAGESLGSTGQAGIILGGLRMFASTGIPLAGTWAVGDIVWNTTPVAAGAPGWVCTTAGTPGTWKAMANLAP